VLLSARGCFRAYRPNLDIEDVGLDFARFKDGATEVWVKFADDSYFTKEDSAAFFRPLIGKPVAIPISNNRSDFFIAVDMWRGDFGEFKVIPMPFATATVEFNGIDYPHWHDKMKTWKVVRRASGEPCWLCNEIGDYATYQSPDWSRSNDWSYDICCTCERRLALAW